MISVALFGIGRAGGEVVKEIAASGQFRLSAVFCRDGSPKAGVYESIVAMVQALKVHIDHAKEESRKAQLAADQAQKAQLVAYATAYDERYKAPVSTFGGHGYDSLHLAVKAIADAKSDKPEAIRDALEKIKGFAGIGGIFTFTPEDHAGLGPDAFIMLGIEKGDWVIVGQ